MKTRQKPAAQQPDTTPPISVQEDLFAPDPSRLPDREELSRLYNQLNEKHFGGKLPQAAVDWSTRLRIAGNCRPDKRDIRLSVRYHTYYPEEITNTLLHEMLHLVYPKHNISFCRAAEKLGVTIHCREYPGLHPRSRLTYICPQCRTVYYRQKRADISCGKCSGQAYDPRYKLVLKKSSTRRPKVRRRR